MTIATLISTCEKAGIRLIPAGENGLTVDTPADALTVELRETLTRRKRDLLPVLWRLCAMRRLAAEAPRPVAYAKAEACGGPGWCFSCGDALDHPAAYGRCCACDIAADLFYAVHATTDAVLL